MTARNAIAICLLHILLTSCRQHNQPAVKRAPPTLILWAWDRAEDLRFLKPGEAEVAALMATIQLQNGEEHMWRRRLPLFVAPGVTLRAVVRMESDGSKLPPMQRVSEQVENLASGFKALQIDFDARQSQLEWYQSLLLHLEGRNESRNQFGIQTSDRPPTDLSITALASWCGPQPWMARVRPALKEVVPMLFRMGPQRVDLLNQLARKKEFAEECRGSIGTSLDEPLPWYPVATRVYIFNPKRWTKEAFDQACARWR